MKKLVTFATAASLMLGSMGVTAYGASFADIDTVTWSGFKPFLNQAAELGLMNGYDENGRRYCKPRNNVTYCEAVQLMYSIMKVYTKQDVNLALNRPQGSNPRKKYLRVLYSLFSRSE